MADTAVLRIRVESNGINTAKADLGALAAQSTRTENVVSRLKGVVGTVAAAIGANEVINYADAWTNVSNKLTNVTKEGESLADVQARIFSISQQTNSTIEATATLYGRLEPATRNLVNSGTDLGNIIETINKAMLVSGASAEESSGALLQLSQGLSSGALRGDEFNSVNETAPRLMQAIADSLGVTRGELRNYAAQGKLTSEVVINAMTSQADAIDTEFSRMDKTFEQKGVQAWNNVVKSIGTDGSLKSAVSEAGDLMVGLSEHVDTLITIGEVMAVTYGSRVANSMTESIAKFVSHQMAAGELAVAEQQAASAAVTQASAERASVVAAQQSLTAQLALAQSERTRTAIRQQLAANSAAVVAATNAETAAAERLAVANQAVSVSARAAAAAKTTLTSVVGGVPGAVMLAAAAVYYFYQKSEESTQGALDFADSLDVTTQKLREMTPVALAAANGNLSVALQEQEEKAADLRDELTSLEDKYRSGTSASGNYQLSQSQLADLQNQIAIKAGEVEEAENKVSQTRSKQQAITAQLNGTARENYVLMGQMNTVTGIASGIQSALNNVLKIGNQELQKRNNYVSTAKSIFTDKDKSALEGLQRQINLEKLQGEQRAKLQAQYEAKDKGMSGAGADEYVKNTVELYKLQQANESKADAERAATQAAKDAQNQAKQTAEAIEQHKQSIEDMSIELQANRLEAEGNGRAAEELTAKHEAQRQGMGDLTNSFVSARMALYDFEKQQEAAKQASENMKQTVSSFEGLYNNANPMYNIDAEYAKNKAVIAEFESWNTNNHSAALAARAALDKQYETDRLAAAEQFFAAQSTGNALLMGELNAFAQGATSALTGLASGTMSTTEAVQALASSIANEAIGAVVQLGVQYMKQQLLQETMQQMSLMSQQTSALAAQANAAAILAAYAPAGMAASIATMGSAAEIGMMAYQTAMASSQTSSLFAGLFDKGGYIPLGGYGIMSEKGDELKDGVLVHGPANITSRKETANQLSNSNNNQASPSIVNQNNIRMVTVLDPSVVHDYMGSSDGEKVILNVIRNNPGVIKSVGSM